MNNYEKLVEKTAMSLCGGFRPGDDLFEDDGYLFLKDEVRRDRANCLLELLLSPAQIAALKAGGELVVIDSEQPMTYPSVVVAGFRKVVEK